MSFGIAPSLSARSMADIEHRTLTACREFMQQDGSTLDMWIEDLMRLTFPAVYEEGYLKGHPEDVEEQDVILVNLIAYQKTLRQRGATIWFWEVWNLDDCRSVAVGYTLRGQFEFSYQVNDWLRPQFPGSRLTISVH